MRIASCYRVLPLVAVLALGCEPVSSPTGPEPAKTEAPEAQPQPEARRGPRPPIAAKKKREAGISKAPTISTKRRENL